MKGTIALVAGIFALITGAMCFIPEELGFFLVVLMVITMASGILASSLGNRAWRNDRQAVGLIGFILGMVGWVEMLIAVALAYF